jgi:hypothetical protein
MQITCSVLCYHIFRIWLYHTFPHYLKKGKILGKVIELKVRFLFCPQIDVEPFLSRIQRYFIMNMYIYICIYIYIYVHTYVCVFI